VKPPGFESWGRFPKAEPAAVLPIFWRSDRPFQMAPPPFLPFGMGRSYGDSCLNGGATLLATRHLDRFLAMDEARQLVTCEAGVTLGEILEQVVPRGLFLPVVPGTKHVSVGGAIANDVHGKNHHRAGTFGAHVASLELLRSDGSRLTCSRTERPELFAATIGGLGLTGVILSASIRLQSIGPGVEHVQSETVPVRALDELLALVRESDGDHEFTVAWIDCLATGTRVGRGLLHRGNWAAAPRPSSPRQAPRLSVPMEFPVSPLNRFTLSAFNCLYRAKGRVTGGPRFVHHDSFFFPLDRIGHWNRIYGTAGLLQFQCAVPHVSASSAIRQMLGAIAAAGEGSFLAVLKDFGSVGSPGMLSFPREGVTLALDFPNKGDRTAGLFRKLHAMVAAHGGRLYPAKDAHMSAEQFRMQFGDVLPRFRAQIDPAFSSSFWRRVQQ